MGDVDIGTSEEWSLKSPCLNKGDPWGGKQRLQDDAHFQAGNHSKMQATGKDIMAQEHWMTKGSQRAMKPELNDLWIACSFQHYQFIILPNKHQIYILFVRNIWLCIVPSLHK